MRNDKRTGTFPRALLTAALFVIQLTWGFPQTLLGFFVFLKNIKEPHSLHRFSVYTRWRDDLSGVSLGLFTFTGSDCMDDMKNHELGHCVQSLILGPLYLFVIGLPSLIWNRRWTKNLKRGGLQKNYFTFFTEKWAESIKKRLT